MPSRPKSEPRPASIDATAAPPICATGPESGAAEIAENICLSFDRKSPFAFVSDPDKPVQHIVGLFQKKIKFADIQFSPSQPADDRAALISAIRRKGREISDVGGAKSMSPALRMMYGRDKRTAIGMGLALPHKLVNALLIAEEEHAREPN